MPTSFLRRNSILVTGISPLMLKARLMGSKTSSIAGVSITEELLSEETGSELSGISELMELLELLLTGLEEEAELEGAGALLEEEVLLEVELEEEELVELLELLEEPPGPNSLMPALPQTAIK